VPHTSVLRVGIFERAPHTSVLRVGVFDSGPLLSAGAPYVVFTYGGFRLWSAPLWVPHPSIPRVRFLTLRVGVLGPGPPFSRVPGTGFDCDFCLDSLALPLALIPHLRDEASKPYRTRHSS
jgi:hypothetical protein